MNFKIKPPQNASLHLEGIFVNTKLMGEILRGRNGFNRITPVFVDDSHDRVFLASRNGRSQPLIKVSFITGHGIALTTSDGIASPLTASKPLFRSIVESFLDCINQIGCGFQVGLSQRNHAPKKYFC